jgi:tetratricopeptide (TPR) repeat protein
VDLLGLASAALDAGEHKRALKAYEKAAGAPDLRVEALLGVATVQNELGKRGKALAAVEAALESSGSPDEEAKVHDQRGLILAARVFDTLVEVERLSERPGKKKPTYGQQVAEQLALAEAAHRRALELTEGEMTAAWRHLADLLAVTGRYQDSRNELVAFFEHDPEGREKASDVLEYLECVGDVADLDTVVRPGDDEVSPAIKQFHPSPRWSGEEAPRAGWAVGVVDVDGRYRCVRLANAAELAPEVRDLYLSSLDLWRFQPASLGEERVPSYFADTVEIFVRP